MSPRDQDLMERYIYAVTRRLPRAQREEIADELRELIGGPGGRDGRGPAGAG